MQDLLGRLTALDPDASETLKVVSYFDTLLARSVGVESMLRGAAVLSGVAVGYRDGRQVVRVQADGERIDPVELSASWPVREAGGDAIVWIEREGNPHSSDAMILERLALAVGIVRARRSIGQESSVELALSTYAAADERAAALSRLRLSDIPVIVVASPPDPTPLPQHPSAVIATLHGLTRATLLPKGLDPKTAWPQGAEPRLGIGLTGTTLPESWASAITAARLTSKKEPVIASADLGAALIVAQSVKAAATHPDVIALASLDSRDLDLLDAVVEEQSIRGAATRLGRHHSSVQERLATVIDALGYDPRTYRGRTRFALARMLFALRE
ncbi:helix-turn-helix domain-containing protein [Paenarthrobacter sp. NPDC089322]|uniref:helix-turn-helix domain-containing protein n=1 Tax=Paenarthrobacter sp. NPDC089322 TaxID=3155065 RepID=UPI003445CF11